MKKSDIAMIILIASVSVMTAWAIASNLSFLKVDPEGTEVDSIELVTATVDPPDPTVFNARAINPTVKTIIGGSDTDNN